MNETKKVVLNGGFGAFSLSKEAYEFLGLEWDDCGCPNISREDARLVECVEKLGKKAGGLFTDIKIVEIPADVEYTIEHYFGVESIHEVHRVWK